jgi:hypothetical protein
MIHRISDKPLKPPHQALRPAHRLTVRVSAGLVIPVGDTGNFTPSPKRPVCVRSRSLLADTHFEPHSHPWAQLAYCATGVLQVTAESGMDGREISYIVPPSRAVWIAAGARHHVTVLEAAEFRTLYIDASATPPGCGNRSMHWTLRRLTGP